MEQKTFGFEESNHTFKHNKIIRIPKEILIEKGIIFKLNNNQDFMHIGIFEQESPTKFLFQGVFLPEPDKVSVLYVETRKPLQNPLDILNMNWKNFYIGS